jgi:hypothetical protein
VRTLINPISPKVDDHVVSIDHHISNYMNRTWNHKESKSFNPKQTTCYIIFFKYLILFIYIFYYQNIIPTFYRKLGPKDIVFTDSMDKLDLIILTTRVATFPFLRRATLDITHISGKNGHDQSKREKRKKKKRKKKRAKNQLA